jgi:hypothetical protein
MAAYWIQLRQDHIADRRAKGLSLSELPSGLIDETDFLTTSTANLMTSDSDRKWPISCFFFCSNYVPLSFSKK